MPFIRVFWALLLLVFQHSLFCMVFDFICVSHTLHANGLHCQCHTSKGVGYPIFQPLLSFKTFCLLTFLFNFLFINLNKGLFFEQFECYERIQVRLHTIFFSDLSHSCNRSRSQRHGVINHTCHQNLKIF